jgi:hypothetical protein
MDIELQAFTTGRTRTLSATRAADEAQADDDIRQQPSPRADERLDDSPVVGDGLRLRLARSLAGVAS